MINKIKQLYLYIKDKFSKHYVVIRKYDFDKIKEFYSMYKDDIKELFLCMGFDKNVFEYVVYNNKVINPIECFSCVAGVKTTTIDVPCFTVLFKSGASIKFECFKYYAECIETHEKIFNGTALNPQYAYSFRVFDETNWKQLKDRYNYIANSSI